MDLPMHLGESLIQVTRHMPIFVGYTEDKKKLVVYRKIDNSSDFFIRHPESEKLCALSPGSSFDWTTAKMQDKTIVTIQSPEWFGTAVGNRSDVLAEPDLLA